MHNYIELKNLFLKKIIKQLQTYSNYILISIASSISISLTELHPISIALFHLLCVANSNMEPLIINTKILKSNQILLFQMKLAHYALTLNVIAFYLAATIIVKHASKLGSILIHSNDALHVEPILTSFYANLNTLFNLIHLILYLFFFI